MHNLDKQEIMSELLSVLVECGANFSCETELLWVGEMSIFSRALALSHRRPSTKTPLQVLWANMCSDLFLEPTDALRDDLFRTFPVLSEHFEDLSFTAVHKCVLG